jgi:hypothetical protein
MGSMELNSYSHRYYNACHFYHYHSVFDTELSRYICNICHPLFQSVANAIADSTVAYLERMEDILGIFEDKKKAAGEEFIKQQRISVEKVSHLLHCEYVIVCFTASCLILTHSSKLPLN